MPQDNSNHILKFDDIPPIFNSDLTMEPFRECIQCEKDLINSGEYYLIEKAFTQTLPHNTKSTIFEYALCYSCWLNVKETLSEQSMTNIHQFFTERVDFEKRNERLLNPKDKHNLDNWISRCIVNDSPIEEAKEFQLACFCVGQHILYDHLPYMISGEAMDEIQDLISNKTLEEMDGFKEKLTRPSPDLEELFVRKKVVLL